jgi:hypothetical protein
MMENILYHPILPENTILLIKLVFYPASKLSNVFPFFLTGYGGYDYYGGGYGSQYAYDGYGGYGAYDSSYGYDYDASASRGSSRGRGSYTH